MTKVQHRRADDSTWREANPVIPDGEIALVKRSDGYDVVIGDGTSTYEELTTLKGNIITSDDEYPNVTLTNNQHVRFGYVEFLSINLDYKNAYGYFSMLTFKTYDYTPTITFENYEGIRFSGNHIEDGIFVPRPCMHYTFIFWEDGGINCHVRGVYEE